MAAVGLVTGSTAVTIGAMVLAPLLGPNVALAFGATLGDVAFVRKALAANLSGLLLALLLSAAAGAVVAVDPDVATIASRTAPFMSGGINATVIARARIKAENKIICGYILARHAPRVYANQRGMCVSVGVHYLPVYARGLAALRQSKRCPAGCSQVVSAAADRDIWW